MLTGDLALFGELLHGDGSRRHRRGAAQQNGQAEIEPEPPQRGGDRRQCRRHLQAAGQQDVGAGGEQGGQRELQPDHEHQEDKAELGQEPCIVAGRHEVQAIRPDRKARQEITHGGRHS